MKLLHTSDLHLGHRLLERSRIAEQARFLDWLVELISQESIDLLIIAGDIFDTGSPPNSALKLYYDFLTRIADTGCLATIIIGGNHDSTASLNAPRQLLKHFRVHVVGGAASPAEELYILHAESGEEIACIGCVPFLRERELRTPRPGESFAERDRSLAAAQAEHYRKVAQARNSAGELPFVVTGHLFAGGSGSGGERDLYVGSLGQVDASVFPSEADYIALGHLHRAQLIGGDERIRYSGSPLPLDFNDDASKGVIIANLDSAGALSTEFFPVPVFRRLVSLSGSLPEVLWRLNDEAGRGEEFIPWLDITITEPVPEAQEQIEEAAQELEMEILRVRYGRRSAEDAWEEVDEQLDELSPEEVFRRRCESRGEAVDEELLRAFNELLIKAQASLAEEVSDESSGDES